MNSLFDERRRGEIRLALRRGEPVRSIRANASPAFAKATGMVEGISEILDSRSLGESAEMIQYRLGRELLMAVLGRNELMAEAALARSAPVDARRLPLNATRLFMAGGEGAFDRSVTKTQGDTTLMIAVQNHDWEMVKLLINRNADVNARVNYGAYPTPTDLVYAEKLGFAQMISYLQGRGALR